ncbi:hypothetical protein NP493_525g02021 [Ridgeia piscesae]|uniref:Uncharacterized protein n=1 Tax=Ridgeia piscesae TaxID=27915 RepID=A0AAD9NQC3_RIDPI|nr:hypothetical protein NP493_525g02021 [Ridgeia piscesae]
MEEAEKMEKPLSKKVQDTVKGLRETLGGMKTPTKVNISIPSLQKSAAGCGSDMNLPTASAVSFMEESPLQVNVSNAVLPAGGGIPAETTPPLKLKLVLSPNKEVPLSETMDVISPSAYDMELDDGGGVLQIAEPASAPKRSVHNYIRRFI